jgi:hypothetical protein
VQAWQESRRKAKKTTTGARPLGYRRDPDQPNRLFIDAAEAKAVRDAAKAVLKGQSLHSIAAGMAASGVTGTRGTRMSNQRLRALLLSPTIAACREVPVGSGVFVDCASKDWPPILKRETWDRVRDVLTDPVRRHPNHTTALRHWLTGVIVCGRCPDDSKMRVAPNKNGPKYLCRQCGLSIDKTKTDKQLEEALLGLLDRKTWRRLQRGHSTGPDTAGFEEAMRELTERFVAGDIDGEEMGALATALRQEVVAVPVLTLPDVDNLRATWPRLDVRTRRVVLSAATESLTIAPATRGFHFFDPTRIAWVPTA